MNSRLPYVPALDGLRAVAVMGVLAFHGGHLTGGHLGVDAFFVLSGFLITALLLREEARSGSLDLCAFWRRRARRLFPALLAMMAGVAAYAALVALPDELPRIRADGLWTLLYLANWHAIRSGHDYWDLFTPPSPLEHTWSLAIEEQFYLAWPPMLYALMRFGRWRYAALAATCATLAMLSATWATIVSVSTGDASRVYFGTDTRAAAILIGATLAVVLHARGPIRARRARTWLEVAAGIAVLGLAVAWARVPWDSPWLHRGLLPACGLAVAVVLAALVHPEPGPIARGLSIVPLRWIGRVSYGVYLWHWPTALILRRGRFAPSGWHVVGEIAIAFALAAVSYYTIERPIRRDGLAAWRWTPAAPLTAAFVVALFFTTTRTEMPPRPRETALDPALPTGGSTRMFITGDSVAWEIATAITRDHADLGLTVAVQVAPSCAIGRGDTGETLVQGTIVRERSGCQRWRAGIASHVRTFQPDMSLVLFGGGTFGRRKVDGQWRGMCDAAYLRHYRVELDAFLADLSATGAPVHLVIPPPPLAVHLPGDAQTFADCLNREGIAAAHARAPLVRLIRLDEWLCPPPNDSCRQTHDGIVLRPDGVHFGFAGAHVIARWLTAQAHDASHTRENHPPRFPKSTIPNKE